jgi:putative ABC transport system substrate-binding protein
MIKTIPVVMGFGADAVRRGIVTDLARPGGNITGITDIGAEIYGKRLELLGDIVPKLSRVGVLWSSNYPDADIVFKETETVARVLKIDIQSLEVKGPNDFERAFQAATKKRAGALLVMAGGVFGFNRKRIIELAEKHRLPATYDNSQSVEAGGLMSYTADRKEQFRRAAEYVDKILKGTKPADLPVERPTKFELVINLKAAKQIGLTIPQSLLYRADKVIR